MDEGGDSWSESLQLVRAGPDQEPAIVLDTSGESRSESSASADTNPTLVYCRRV